VDPEEVLEELLVGPLVLVEGDPDGLGVVLDVAVGRVLVRGVVGVPGGASRVPDDRLDDALLAIEVALRAPESPHGRLEGRVDVLGGRQERADLAGLGLLGGEHVVVVLLGFHLVEPEFLAGGEKFVVLVLFAAAAGRGQLEAVGIDFVSRRKRDGTEGLASRNPRRC